MNELPRRPIEPLPPPPGQLDAVLARARYRRHRRVTTVLAVSTVFLAGVAGGLSLGGVAGVQDRIESLAADVVASQTPTSSPSPRAQTVRKERARKTHSPAPEAPSPSPPPTTPPAVVQPEPPAALAVNGRAVDSAGEPVAGLFVYAGRQGVDGFVPTSRPAGRTAADGTFTLPCTRTPVLLSPWPVNAPAAELAGSAGWAATFVGGATDATGAAKAACSRTGRVVDTVVQQGSVVEGTATMPSECADAVHPLWLWLHNDRGLTVRVPDVVNGATYRIAGLPPGQHTVGAKGNRTLVTVGGGATATLDVTFACAAGTPVPTTEPTPTETPAPAPVPTDTATSEPTPSGSVEPTGAARPAPTTSPTSGTVDD